MRADPEGTWILAYETMQRDIGALGQHGRSSPCAGGCGRNWTARGTGPLSATDGETVNRLNFEDWSALAPRCNALYRLAFPPAEALCAVADIASRLTPGTPTRCTVPGRSRHNTAVRPWAEALV
jgi:hypothetical protein